MNIYDILKIILTFFAFCGICGMILFLFRWIVMFLARNPDLKKRKKLAIGVLISMITVSVCGMLNFMVAIYQYTRPPKLDELPQLSLSSAQLKDGVWADEIGKKTENLSPSLSWSAPFEGCEDYVIVMLDESADNWVHWLAVTNTAGVKEGSFGEYNYVGPYPPSGTHTYTVYVFALKSPERPSCATLDMGGLKLSDLTREIDSSVYVEYKNIAAVGKLSGTYSAK